MIALTLCYILKTYEPLLLVLLNVIHFIVKKPIQIVMTDGVRCQSLKKWWYQYFFLTDKRKIYYPQTN
jgi:hypothetical protein